MAPTLRRVLILLVVLCSMVGGTGLASAGVLADQQRAERAIGYLRAQQRANGAIVAFSPIGSTADAVLAIVSAGVGPRVLDRAIGFLRLRAAGGKVDGIGLQAKVALAVVSAGLDARRFGGMNLVKQIRSSVGLDGHLGDAAVLDQALGVLAVVGAGASLPTGATQWLLDAQCPDGGWAYDAPYDPMVDDDSCLSDPADFFVSDTNTTAYVVQALAAAGDDTWTDDPFAFFDGARDPAGGGWAYSPGFLVTDANSTALVLQAYAAAGMTPPPGGPAALRHLQHRRCGAWAYTYESGSKGAANVGATIGAVPGLLLDPFPLTGPVHRSAPDVPDCPAA